MEQYQRGFRDATSPLTPLTPLIGNFFDFNIDAASGQPTSTSTSSSSLREVSKSPLAVGMQAALNKLFQPQERGYTLGAEPKRRRYSNKENESPLPTPSPFELKRRIKREPENQEQQIVPHIRIEAPSQRHRRGSNFAYDDHPSSSYDIDELSEDTDFVLQQKKQLDLYKNQRQRRHFDASKIRPCSPVAPKPLSPRLGAFLSSWGMNCLKSIFERQEIDIETFCCLTHQDLNLLGIEDRENQELVLKAVDFMKNQFQKRTED